MRHPTSQPLCCSCDPNEVARAAAYCDSSSTRLSTSLCMNCRRDIQSLCGAPGDAKGVLANYMVLLDISDPSTSSGTATAKPTSEPTPEYESTSDQTGKSTTGPTTQTTSTEPITAKLTTPKATTTTGTSSTLLTAIPTKYPEMVYY